MKNKTGLPALLALLSLTACERDPFPLDLTRYEVFWNDLDASGDRSLDDEVLFNITVNTTAADPDVQYITQWELSYTVNGAFGGVLLNNHHENGNTINVNANVALWELDMPGPDDLQPGDALEFHFWVIDNQGVELTEHYAFPLAP